MEWTSSSDQPQVICRQESCLAAARLLHGITFLAPQVGPAQLILVSGITIALRAAMRDEYFTIGGVLARVWRPTYPLLPWALTSALLTVAGVWDHWTKGAPVEWLVLGLAAYELMIGLLSTAGVDEEVPLQAQRNGDVTVGQVGPSRTVHGPLVQHFAADSTAARARAREGARTRREAV